MIRVYLTGRRFGRLLVISPTQYRGTDNSVKWLCKCDCGKERIISSSHLLRGKSNSCGCLALETRTTHGMSRTKQYYRYVGMMERCYKKNNKRYDDYGGRGIRVCNEWKKGFEYFWNDMKWGYADNLSLDRIDVNGNYCKENCKWSTPKEQSNNMRKNIHITWKGMNKTVPQWADILNIKQNTLRCRYNRGWSLDKLFNQKVQKRLATK